MLSLLQVDALRERLEKVVAAERLLGPEQPAPAQQQQHSMQPTSQADTPKRKAPGTLVHVRSGLVHPTVTTACIYCTHCVFAALRTLNSQLFLSLHVLAVSQATQEAMRGLQGAPA
jgi:hypothetical protein